MSTTKEPGSCPFCAWDHPGDPPHAQGCVIGPYVEFARAEGVAAERARVVAAIKRRAWMLPKAERQALLTVAERLERGLHDREGA